ncbi:hypothetical protein DAKH74_024150 [Maudiozyma humilis]|uniref:Uncharacterized protein n=1 Tax=Maudiozyma humilis TaxID=51915 RepID=A0AAV5RVZ3_MAUHU|nr:hypothetical protein DAKH74_024150 [Kazachstania humilis]
MKESSEQYWASNMKAGGLYTKDICDLCVSPERRVSVKPTPSEVEKSHPTNHEGQRSVDTSVEEEESDAAPLDNTKPHVVIGGEQGPHQSTDVASHDSQTLRPSICVKDTATTSHQEDTTGASFPPDREVPKDNPASHDLDRWLSAFKDEYRHYFKGLVNQVEVVASNCEDAGTACASIFSSTKQGILNVEKKTEEHGTQLKKVWKRQDDDYNWATDLFKQVNTNIELAFSDMNRFGKQVYDKDEENRKWMIDVDDQLVSLWDNDEDKDSRISKLEAIIAQIIGKIPGLRLDAKKEVVLQEGEGFDEVSTPGTKQVDDSTEVSIIDTSRDCEKNETARLTEMLKSQATIIEEMKTENAEARAAFQQKFASMELKVESLNARANDQAAEIDSLKKERVESASLIAKLTESHKSDLASVKGSVDELNEKVIEVESTVDNFSGDSVNALLSTNVMAERVLGYEAELKKVKELYACQNKDIDNIRGGLDLKTEELEETKTLCEWQHNELRQVKTFLAAQDNAIETFKSAIASHGKKIEAIEKTTSKERRDLHTALSSQKDDIKSIMDFIQTPRTQEEQPHTYNREHQQSWNSSDTAGSQDSLDSQLYYRFDKTFGATEDSKREQSHKATVSTSHNAEIGSIQYLAEELGCASVQEGVFPTETSAAMTLSQWCD